MGDAAVEETLDRQLHEVDVAVHARTAMPEQQKKKVRKQTDTPKHICLL